jgi:DNA polymerase-3 subunit delta'
MSWLGLEGHDDIVERFRRILAAGRLASTYLFVGPPGVGKRTFATKLAEGLLCQRPAGVNPAARGVDAGVNAAAPGVNAAALDPCGVCASCIQMRARTHPDFFTVARPKGKSEIPVAALIGDAEHRMQQGLCHDIGLKPMMGGRRIAIIDDADDLNEESANCLLKTLEEPPPRSLMILIGTSASRQLPTIRSRSQIVRFAPLSVEIVERLLVSQQIVADAGTARQLAGLSEGSLARAAELADPELLKFRAALFGRLAQADLDVPRLAEAVMTVVEEAGSEASARRERLRTIIQFAADYYRQLARSLWGARVADEAAIAQSIASARRWWPTDADLAVECVDRTLDALVQIDRNANPANVVYAWLDDLAQLTRATSAALAG